MLHFQVVIQCITSSYFNEAFEIYTNQFFVIENKLLLNFRQTVAHFTLKYYNIYKILQYSTLKLALKFVYTHDEYLTLLKSKTNMAKSSFSKKNCRGNI